MGWISKIKWNSIHTKLLATYLLLTTLGTSLMAGYVLWSFHAYFMSMRQTEMRNWSTAINESVADALEENDRERVKLIMRRYGAAETITIRVFDSKGKLIASSSPQQDQQVKNWLEVPGIRAALERKEVQGFAKGVLTNDDRLFIAQPIVRNGQLLGVLRMSITLQQFQRQFAIVIWTVLGTLVFILLLCTFISEWLARSLSRPIQTMKNFAIRLGSGHFGDKLQIRQSNELDQLALELNRMSERLASLDQERRAFLANVSHELRTPISNVLVTVEALRNGAASDPAVSDRFFQNVEDETKRLSRLIGDLLDLGRLEAGVTLLEKQHIQLVSLIKRAVRAVETRLQNSQISVQVNVADLQIQGDSERLLQALLNLLDNAIKHSPPNSQILITGSKEGKQAVVTIRDQGQGVKDSDLSRIFEQFYTGDHSRKGRGVGLGLAIAKRIIEAHGGSITVSSKVGEGATFTIYLPI
ncbi:two-component sensor histidine kinase [Fischerella muscicola CCMEE 5323]|uniref:histidine kinase n=1 Tax=Fischerella muscicola CCMEE 5323 TaxID=2019572 RepID=A0A2N6K688_FISMU|nr:ATP-binding protein [Fischerella muscicola]PLZ92358.1 two-component sensor histidine kinase [Fischerella muscicola CCMEE 5323]